MPSTVKILPHYTYDDYTRWEGRWELIEGIPYAMSPVPSPKHQSINANMQSEFRVALQNAGCKKCRIYNFIDVKIAEDTILQPDALIICKDIQKPFLDFSAALVVEILSPSTALKDRNTKFNLYEQFGINYYIIVDSDKKEIECYKLSETKQYRQEMLNTATPFSIQLDTDCAISVVFDNIWE